MAVRGGAYPLLFSVRSCSITLVLEPAVDIHIFLSSFSYIFLLVNHCSEMVKSHDYSFNLDALDSGKP